MSDQDFLKIIGELKNLNEALISKHQKAQSQMQTLGENHQKILKEVERTMDFLLGVSFQIRNSLTILNLALQDISEKITPPQKSVFEKQLKFIERVVSRMIQMRQIDADESRPKKINFSFLVRNLCAATRSTSHRWSVKIENQIFISGVEKQIETALFAILENAQKFTPRGKKVKVKLTPKLQDAVLEISDDGCGIEKADQKRIFDRFYTTANHKGVTGVGLGLNLARKIIRRNGGKIKVISDKNKGSTFFIIFPREIE